LAFIFLYEIKGIECHPQVYKMVDLDIEFRGLVFSGVNGFPPPMVIFKGCFFFLRLYFFTLLEMPFMGLQGMSIATKMRIL